MAPSFFHLSLQWIYCMFLLDLFDCVLCLECLYKLFNIKIEFQQLYYCKNCNHFVIINVSQLLPFNKNKILNLDFYMIKKNKPIYIMSLSIVNNLFMVPMGDRPCSTRSLQTNCRWCGSLHQTPSSCMLSSAAAVPWDTCCQCQHRGVQNTVSWHMHGTLRSEILAPHRLPFVSPTPTAPRSDGDSATCSWGRLMLFPRRLAKITSPEQDRLPKATDEAVQFGEISHGHSWNIAHIQTRCCQRHICLCYG